MKTRVLAGLCMVPLLLIVFFGGIPLKLLVLVVTIMAMREFFRVYKQANIYASLPIAIISVLALYAMNFIGVSHRYDMLWMAGTVIVCLLYMFPIKKKLPEDAMLTLTGIFYIGFLAYHLSWMANFGEYYSRFVWLVIIAAFVTDIAAYFCGYLFGNKKLCPDISPKKTIAGAIGGIIFAAIFSLLFGILFTNVWYHCLIMGILGSIAAQAGDLTASIFKRKIDVKDFGTLIPGHGGVLDRIDSILFAAPVICWYTILFVMH